MKVALLISGYLRSYDINLKYIEAEILNKFDHVDVFLHITSNEKNEDKYINSVSDEEAINSFTAALNPLSTIIESNIHYYNDSNLNSLINQWHKLFKLNDLKKKHEEINGKKYDLVIRFRPDLTINGKGVFSDLIEGVITIPSDSKIDNSKLRNPNDLHICDALAFGDSTSMDKYFGIYEHILDLVHEYGYVSETILYWYLNKNKINYKVADIDYGFTLSKCNVFAIAGDSGSGKSTLGELLKGVFTNSFMLECDRYHKWERGDKNWDNVTHLNPSANYITKMVGDIFNLKLGNDIYQVDYNHHSGKFTDKQIINSSDNIIVCGLHSLYTDSIYDLKIFIDTEESLKKKWKIKRDVRDRGYSVQKVLDSIAKRESDFNEFILPQKDNADLIIKFFTLDKIDFNDYNKPERLSLELTINNNFNLTEILSRLDEIGVEYFIKKDNYFNKIIFNEYNNLVLFKDDKIPRTNTFYDYIMYVIFNLVFTNK